MAAPYAVHAPTRRARLGPPRVVELDDFDPRRHTLRTIADRLAAPDHVGRIGRAATPASTRPASGLAELH